MVFGHKPLVAVDRVGTDIANRINGGDRNDTISGLAGDDTLIGHARRDQILGGLGNDTVTGGIGNDTVEGSAGSDDLDGGDDEDWLSYASSNAAIAMNLNTGAARRPCGGRQRTCLRKRLGLEFRRHADRFDRR